MNLRIRLACTKCDILSDLFACEGVGVGGMNPWHCNEPVFAYQLTVLGLLLTLPAYVHACPEGLLVLVLQYCKVFCCEQMYYRPTTVVKYSLRLYCSSVNNVRS